MRSTDYLRLNELKIFKVVRESLPKNLTKTTNLITVKDGVLFTWDFDNSCVLTLNVKAAKSREGDNVSHQNLLPLDPVLFQPELLVANDNGTLLMVAGPSGVLIMELPARHPPYGTFEHNKELVYCRSYSLDERLFLSNDVIQVRQAKFHPASSKNTHIVVLTSDNTLRLYNIENNNAIRISNHQIGPAPVGTFPGTKTSYLAAFGEVGVDFDFGQPELDEENTSLIKQKTNLRWPVYVLRGDGSIYIVDVFNVKSKSSITGPLLTNTIEKASEEACSIICLNSNPEVFCVANSNGTIYHSILLPLADEDYERLREDNPQVPKKELLCFESIELELGLSTSDEENAYTCPIFLHRDDSKTDRYFATHSAGIHSVTIASLNDLQGYVSDSIDDQLGDIFIQESKAEYLLCTKTSTSERNNPVIGFALYYEPTSLISLLGDGNLVTLGILTTETLKNLDKSHPESILDDANSSVKKMLREPFDVYIQKILKRSSSQPILKLPSTSDTYTQKQCSELIAKASQIFHEYFENHTRAYEELEKRMKALHSMKQHQFEQLQRMNNEKAQLQEKAESLAEKYEDIKDRQDEIMKRCERLLILVSQKKAEPSDAEKEYLKELGEYMEKIEMYKKSIEKLKMKMNYQKIQMKNWTEQEQKKVSCLSESHAGTIKSNLKEMSDRITEMVKEVNDFKQKVNLK